MIPFIATGKVRGPGLEGQDNLGLEHIESEMPLGHPGDVKWQQAPASCS